MSGKINPAKKDETLDVSGVCCVHLCSLVWRYYSIHLVVPLVSSQLDGLDGLDGLDTIFCACCCQTCEAVNAFDPESL